MTKYLLGCFALIACVNAFAQSMITGTVLDEHNAPLMGANVVLDGANNLGDATDANGQFTVVGVSDGLRKIRVTYVGYITLDTTIMVAHGTQHLFRMRPNVHLITGVEVTALRAGDRAPFAKSTVTRATIDRINTGVDLPYVLDQQPSVVSTSDGGTGIGYTYLRIRGTDGTRTNITVNGVPFNDPESQGAFLVNMPDLVTSAEDIEIQRGVGTSTNGPAAFGASVNVRTTAVKREPWALVGVSGGSFNTQRYSVSAGTGLVNDHFSLDVRLSSITSDGYVDRASADLKSYFLQGAWIGAKRSLRIITFRGKELTYQAWGGVPRDVIDTNRTYNGYTYANEVDHYDQTHYQLLFDQQLGANTKVNLTLFRVLGAGYFEQYRADDDLATYGIAPAVINGDTITTSDFIRRRWLDNTLTGANASAEITFGAHRLVLGGSYAHYEGAHFGEVIWARYAGATNIGDRYYQDDARKTDGNAFAKLNYAINPRLDVFGDLQMRHVAHRLSMFNTDFVATPQTVAYTFFNPKAGVLWKVNATDKAYASVAVANREPDREDLVETTPESRPRSEQLVDYELGYERRSARFSGGVNLYYMDYRDQLVLTGELNDVGAALRTNVKSSYRTGVELTFAAQLTKRLTWRGNATLSSNTVRNYTEYLDDWDNGGQVAVEHAESDLSFSPSLIAGSELSVRLLEKEKRARVDLTLVTKYVGTQYLDNSASADRQLDPYVVHDARVNVTLFGLRGTRSVDLNLTVRNLFSELYESNGWAYSYVSDGRRQELVGLYPQAPVNVLGRVAVRF
ncbi:MAG: TonB-dependent receptor [Flavobacteriales bacterium]|nr:TonB-dependent receptor [Flavobacteriales bacterium]